MNINNLIVESHGYTTKPHDVVKIFNGDSIVTVWKTINPRIFPWDVAMG